MPIAVEIEDDEDNKVLKEQVTYLEEYNLHGYYKRNFINLLNSYRTINDSHTEFSMAEITMLSSDSAECSTFDRVVAQLKYYRKMQEIQCTCYVLLRRMLFYGRSFLNRIKLFYDFGHPKANMTAVKNYVYHMLAMLFDGNFVIYNWLWELYVKLVAVADWKANRKFIRPDLFDESERRLDGLIASCEHNDYYHSDGRHRDIGDPKAGNAFDFFSDAVERYRCRYAAKYKFVIDDYGDFFIPQNLYLKRVWDWDDAVFEDVPGVVIEWANTRSAFGAEREKVERLLRTGEWIAGPFRHIEYHRMFLAVMKVKLYGYVWFHLYGLLREHGSRRDRVRSLHSEFMEYLYGMMMSFLYSDDAFTVSVLNRLCEIENTGDPTTIEETIASLDDQVNAILNGYNGGPPEQGAWAYINYEVEWNDKIGSSAGKTDEPDLVKANTYNFYTYFVKMKEELSYLHLTVLSFFIDGSKDTDHIFFPNAPPLELS
ncbi:uncharacterized protein LOC126897743 isoform X2 [Daktulosphaira vitifoliae]|nr:uncharacterized protein LOC126897743 isoform X2 [Daktulosphaira vitifoliae]